MEFEKLRSAHDLNEFGCGQPGLDFWFKTHALRNQEKFDSVTYVGVEDGEVRTFFTLLPTEIKASSAPGRYIAEWPSGRGIPGWLLGRMAVHQEFHLQGFGRQTVKEALRTAAKATEIVGGRVVVLDAKNEDLVGFYERHGFERFREDPLRMGIPMRDVVSVVN